MSMAIVRVKGVSGWRVEYIEVPDIMWENALKEKKTVGFANYDIWLDTQRTLKYKLPTKLPFYRELFEYLRARSSFEPMDSGLERVTIKKT